MINFISNILIKRSEEDVAAKAQEVADQAASLMSNQYSATDMAYVLISTVVVFMVTPGIGLYYGGLLHKKSALSILVQSYIITGVVYIQWYLFGYSLACADGSSIYGTLKLGGLKDILLDPFIEGSTIPLIVYFPFSALFAVATAQLVAGAIAERGRLLPSIVVAFWFVTLVYCPEAYWTWSGKGWLYNLGALDFAGGGPVHISSGFASLAYSLALGKRIHNFDHPNNKIAINNDSILPTNFKLNKKIHSNKKNKLKSNRRDSKTEKVEKFNSLRKYSCGSVFRHPDVPLPGRIPPHNSTLVFIGVLFIWFAWLTFNSGTLLTVNIRTAYIMANTLMASAFGSLTWATVDYIRDGKINVLSVCEGAIAGLVGITPSCGFVYPWAAAIAGIMPALVCSLTHNINQWIGVDDTLMIFNLHGLGGITGSIVLGVFAHPNIAATDGVTIIKGGWIVHHWKQMGYQFAGWASVAAWSFCFTFIICVLVDLVPGLAIRATTEEEAMGADSLELGMNIGETIDYNSFFDVSISQGVSPSDNMEGTSKSQNSNSNSNSNFQSNEKGLDTVLDV